MLTVVVSIDTEEDNWSPTRDGVTVRNIDRLPALEADLRDLGVRSTYFVNYRVAADLRAGDVIQSLADGGAEIGTHVHPWNTPPLDEPFVPRLTMLKNLDPTLQRAKIETVTELLERVLGRRPTSFRAGRWGIGPEAIAALIELGYEVDSSVLPFTDWRDVDDGPCFYGAPNSAYRVDGVADVCLHRPAGALIELPVSAGFTRHPFKRWHQFSLLARRPRLRPLRLLGLASAVDLFRRVVMNPELSSVADMLLLARRLREQGQTFLHLMFHSTTLHPGFHPDYATEADVSALRERILGTIAGIAEMGDVEFATVTDAARRVAPARRRAALATASVASA